MGMLGQTENGEKINAKKLILQCIKNSCFYRDGSWNHRRTEGLINRLMDSSFGPGYLSAESILTTGNYAYYPYCCWVQYGTGTGTYRTLYQNYFSEDYFAGAMIMGVLIAVKYLVGSSRLLNLAIIIYMSSPATFSMQTFLKKKESSAYASTTNSLYCIVSILVYIVLAVVG